MRKPIIIVEESYIEQGKYEQAIADYTMRSELNPSYGYAYINRGISYAKQNRYDEAIADYTCAIELNPKSAMRITIVDMPMVNRRSTVRR